MDNRDSKDLKNFKPATEPVIRTRQRPAAAAQAAMYAPGAPVPPAGFAPAGDMQAPTMRKRTTERSLAAPVVYEPSGRDLRSPSVKPIEIRSAGSGRGERSLGMLFFLSILVGIASGGLLLALNGQNGLLNATDITEFGDVGMIIHCLVWGGILGLLCGFLFSIFYERVPSTLPVYAAMLYMPVLLYLLMPLTYMGTQLVIALVGLVISLIGAAIALFFAWTFICGG